MKLYLAHPFDSRRDMRLEQEIFEKATGIKLINPFYDIHREDIIAIDEGRAERSAVCDPVEIVERDVEAIMNSDGILAIINGKQSVGTMMEIVYSCVVFNLPTYIVCSDGQHLHPWLQYHGCGVFESMEEAIAYFKEL